MGDKSHPETSEIYRYLDDLMGLCRKAGYTPAPESVMHELEEEEREYALRYHSEKLAIAFGLLKTSHGTAIRIVKNLRICEDCHSAIKHISVVTDREIIVRDRLRFHHFKDGKCSQLSSCQPHSLWACRDLLVTAIPYIMVYLHEMRSPLPGPFGQTEPRELKRCPEVLLPHS
ncbi:hypothetical protein FNV43_RR07577 [Rhamnella rubrinervis]|uniref:DYW domain-containing protein n=1 Tax=Rhamnella rubrinervis TaxID=2594499 RepID=A0A8K0HF78_9ROSA|nr:hypothetical protein FNV43_RR07577 [Rhamnella rubrinervis]